MEVKAIRNKTQYQQYLKKADELMEPDPPAYSPEGQLLETIVILIEDYERKQGWEIPLTGDPVEVIKARMQELGLKQTDLAR